MGWDGMAQDCRTTVFLSSLIERMGPDWRGHDLPVFTLAGQYSEGIRRRRIGNIHVIDSQTEK